MATPGLGRSGTGFVSQELKAQDSMGREEEMNRNTWKQRVFWSRIKSLISGGSASPQDIVLKTGKENEFDLSLLLTTRGTNLSVRLAKSV
jgi:hypothetical protein